MKQNVLLQRCLLFFVSVLFFVNFNYAKKDTDSSQLKTLVTSQEYLQSLFKRSVTSVKKENGRLLTARERDLVLRVVNDIISRAPRESLMPLNLNGATTQEIQQCICLIKQCVDQIKTDIGNPNASVDCASVTCDDLDTLFNYLKCICFKLDDLSVSAVCDLDPVVETVKEQAVSVIEQLGITICDKVEDLMVSAACDLDPVIETVKEQSASVIDSLGITICDKVEQIMFSAIDLTDLTSKICLVESKVDEVDDKLDPVGSKLCAFNSKIEIVDDKLDPLLSKVCVIDDKFTSIVSTIVDEVGDVVCSKIDVAVDDLGATMCDKAGSIIAEIGTTIADQTDDLGQTICDKTNSAVDVLCEKIEDSMFSVIDSLDPLVSKICIVDSKVVSIDTKLDPIGSKVCVVDTKLDPILSKVCEIELGFESIVATLVSDIGEVVCSKNDLIVEELGATICEKSDSIIGQIGVTVTDCCVTMLDCLEELKTEVEQIAGATIDIDTILSKVCSIQENIDEGVISKLCAVDSKVDDIDEKILDQGQCLEQIKETLIPDLAQTVCDKAGSVIDQIGQTITDSQELVLSTVDNISISFSCDLDPVIATVVDQSQTVIDALGVTVCDKVSSAVDELGATISDQTDALGRTVCEKVSSATDAVVATTVDLQQEVISAIDQLSLSVVCDLDPVIETVKDQSASVIEQLGITICDKVEDLMVSAACDLDPVIETVKDQSASVIEQLGITICDKVEDLMVSAACDLDPVIETVKDQSASVIEQLGITICDKVEDLMVSAACDLDPVIETVKDQSASVIEQLGITICDKVEDLMVSAACDLDPVIETVKDQSASVIDALGVTVCDKVESATDAIVETVVDQSQTVINDLGVTVCDKVESAIDALGVTITDQTDALGVTVCEKVESATDAIVETVVDQSQTVINDLGVTVCDKVVSVIDALGVTITDQTDALGVTVCEKVESATDAIVETVVDQSQTVINDLGVTVCDKVESAADAIVATVIDQSASVIEQLGVTVCEKVESATDAIVETVVDQSQTVIEQLGITICDKVEDLMVSAACDLDPVIETVKDQSASVIEQLGITICDKVEDLMVSAACDLDPVIETVKDQSASVIDALGVTVCDKVSSASDVLGETIVDATDPIFSKVCIIESKLDEIDEEICLKAESVIVALGQTMVDQSVSIIDSVGETVCEKTESLLDDLGQTIVDHSVSIIDELGITICDKAESIIDELGGRVVPTFSKVCVIESKIDFLTETVIEDFTVVRSKVCRIDGNVDEIDEQLDLTLSKVCVVNSKLDGVSETICDKAESVIVALGQTIVDQSVSIIDSVGVTVCDKTNSAIDVINATVVEYATSIIDELGITICDKAGSIIEELSQDVLPSFSKLCVVESKVDNLGVTVVDQSQTVIEQLGITICDKVEDLMVSAACDLDPVIETVKDQSASVIEQLGITICDKVEDLMVSAACDLDPVIETVKDQSASVIEQLGITICDKVEDLMVSAACDLDPVIETVKDQSASVIEQLGITICDKVEDLMVSAACDLDPVIETVKDQSASVIEQLGITICDKVEDLMVSATCDLDPVIETVKDQSASVIDALGVTVCDKVESATDAIVETVVDQSQTVINDLGVTVCDKVVSAIDALGVTTIDQTDALGVTVCEKVESATDAIVETVVDQSQTVINDLGVTVCDKVVSVIDALGVTITDQTDALGVTVCDKVESATDAIVETVVDQSQTVIEQLGITICDKVEDLMVSAACDLDPVIETVKDQSASVIDALGVTVCDKVESATDAIVATVVDQSQTVINDLGVTVCDKIVSAIDVLGVTITDQTDALGVTVCDKVESATDAIVATVVDQSQTVINDLGVTVCDKVVSVIDALGVTITDQTDALGVTVCDKVESAADAIVATVVDQSQTVINDLGVTVCDKVVSAIDVLGVTITDQTDALGVTVCDKVESATDAIVATVVDQSQTVINDLGVTVCDKVVSAIDALGVTITDQTDALGVTVCDKVESAADVIVATLTDKIDEIMFSVTENTDVISKLCIIESKVDDLGITIIDQTNALGVTICDKVSSAIDVLGATIVDATDPIFTKVCVVESKLDGIDETICAKAESVIDTLGQTIIDQSVSIIDSIGVTVCDKTETLIDQIGQTVVDSSLSVIDELGITICDKAESIIDELSGRIVPTFSKVCVIESKIDFLTDTVVEDLSVVVTKVCNIDENVDTTLSKVCVINTTLDSLDETICAKAESVIEALGQTIVDQSVSVIDVLSVTICDKTISAIDVINATVAEHAMSIIDELGITICDKAGSIIDELSQDIMPSFSKLCVVESKIDGLGITIVDQAQTVINELGVTVCDKVESATDAIVATVVDKSQTVINDLGVTVCDKVESAIDALGVTTTDQTDALGVTVCDKVESATDVIVATVVDQSQTVINDLGVTVCDKVESAIDALGVTTTDQTDALGVTVCDKVESAADVIVATLTDKIDDILFSVTENTDILSKICVVESKIDELNACDCQEIDQDSFVTIGGTYTITESGSYCLCEDATGKIEITVSDVTIDLNKHTLTTPETTDAIDFATDLENLNVINGTIRVTGCMPSELGVSTDCDQADSINGIRLHDGNRFVCVRGVRFDIQGENAHGIRISDDTFTIKKLHVEDSTFCGTTESIEPMVMDEFCQNQKGISFISNEPADSMTISGLTMRGCLFNNLEDGVHFQSFENDTSASSYEIDNITIDDCQFVQLCGNGISIRDLVLLGTDVDTTKSLSETRSKKLSGERAPGSTRTIRDITITNTLFQDIKDRRVFTGTDLDPDISDNFGCGLAILGANTTTIVSNITVIDCSFTGLGSGFSADLSVSGNIGVGVGILFFNDQSRISKVTVRDSSFSGFLGLSNNTTFALGNVSSGLAIAMFTNESTFGGDTDDITVTDCNFSNEFLISDTGSGGTGVDNFTGNIGSGVGVSSNRINNIRVNNSIFTCKQSVSDSDTGVISSGIDLFGTTIEKVSVNGCKCVDQDQSIAINANFIRGITIEDATCTGSVHGIFINRTDTDSQDLESCAQIINCHVQGVPVTPDSPIESTVGVYINNMATVVVRDSSAQCFTHGNIVTDCASRDSGFLFQACGDVVVVNSIAKDNANGFVLCGLEAGGMGSTGIVRDCVASGNAGFGFDVDADNAGVEFYANVACHNGTNYSSLIDSAPIKSPADARGQHNVDCSLLDDDSVDLILSKVCIIESIVDIVDPCDCQQITQDSFGMIGGTYTITESGSYCLCDDATGKIEVAVSDVTIDLNKHTLTSPDGEDAIDFASDSENLTILNGTIRVSGCMPTEAGVSTDCDTAGAVSGLHLHDGNRLICIRGVRFAIQGENAHGIYADNDQLTIKKLHVEDSIFCGTAGAQHQIATDEDEPCENQKGILFVSDSLGMNNGMNISGITLKSCSFSNLQDGLFFQGSATGGSESDYTIENITIRECQFTDLCGNGISIQDGISPTRSGLLDDLELFDTQEKTTTRNLASAGRIVRNITIVDSLFRDIHATVNTSSSLFTKNIGCGIVLACGRNDACFANISLTKCIFDSINGTLLSDASVGRLNVGVGFGIVTRDSPLDLRDISVSDCIFKAISGTITAQSSLELSNVGVGFGFVMNAQNTVNAIEVKNSCFSQIQGSATSSGSSVSYENVGTGFGMVSGNTTNISNVLVQNCNFNDLGATVSGNFSEDNIGAGVGVVNNGIVNDIVVKNCTISDVNSSISNADSATNNRSNIAAGFGVISTSSTIRKVVVTDSIFTNLGISNLSLDNATFSENNFSVGVGLIAQGSVSVLAFDGNVLSQIFGDISGDTNTITDNNIGTGIGVVTQSAINQVEVCNSKFVRFSGLTDFTNSSCQRNNMGMGYGCISSSIFAQTVKSCSINDMGGDCVTTNLGCEFNNQGGGIGMIVAGASSSVQAVSVLDCDVTSLCANAISTGGTVERSNVSTGIGIINLGVNPIRDITVDSCHVTYTLGAIDSSAGDTSNNVSVGVGIISSPLMASGQRIDNVLVNNSTFTGMAATADVDTLNAAAGVALLARNSSGITSATIDSVTVSNCQCVEQEHGISMVSSELHDIMVQNSSGTGIAKQGIVIDRREVEGSGDPSCAQVVNCHMQGVKIPSGNTEQAIGVYINNFSTALVCDSSTSCFKGDTIETDTLETDCILRDSGFYLRNCADVLVDNSIAKDNDNGFVICGGDPLGGTGSTGIVRDCTAEGNTRFGFDVGPEDVNVEFYANIACHNGTNYSSLIDSAPIKSPADARGQHNVDCALTDEDTVDVILSKVCDLAVCDCQQITQDSFGMIGGTYTIIESGSYCLCDDATGKIEVAVSDVTIDLNKHTLTSPDGEDAIDFASGSENLTILNGTIRVSGCMPTEAGVSTDCDTASAVSGLHLHDGNRLICIRGVRFDIQGENAHGIYADNDQLTIKKLHVEDSIFCGTAGAQHQIATDEDEPCENQKGILFVSDSLGMNNGMNISGITLKSCSFSNLQDGLFFQGSATGSSESDYTIENITIRECQFTDLCGNGISIQDGISPTRSGLLDDLELVDTQKKTTTRNLASAGRIVRNITIVDSLFRDIHATVNTSSSLFTKNIGCGIVLACGRANACFSNISLKKCIFDSISGILLSDASVGRLNVGVGFGIVTRDSPLDLRDISVSDCIFKAISGTITAQSSLELSNVGVGFGFVMNAQNTVNAIEVKNSCFSQIQGSATSSGSSVSYENVGTGFGMVSGNTTNISNVLVQNCNFNDLGATVSGNFFEDNIGAGIGVINNGTINDIVVKNCTILDVTSSISNADSATNNRSNIATGFGVISTSSGINNVVVTDSIFTNLNAQNTSFDNATISENNFGVGVGLIAQGSVSVLAFDGNVLSEIFGDISGDTNTITDNNIGTGVGVVAQSAINQVEVCNSKFVSFSGSIDVTNSSCQRNNMGMGYGCIVLSKISAQTVKSCSINDMSGNCSTTNLGCEFNNQGGGIGIIASGISSSVTAVSILDCDVINLFAVARATGGIVERNNVATGIGIVTPGVNFISYITVDSCHVNNAFGEIDSSTGDTSNNVSVGVGIVSSPVMASDQQINNVLVNNSTFTGMAATADVDTLNAAAGVALLARNSGGITSAAVDSVTVSNCQCVEQEHGISIVSSELHDIMVQNSSGTGIAKQGIVIDRREVEGSGDPSCAQVVNCHMQGVKIPSGNTEQAIGVYINNFSTALVRDSSTSCFKGDTIETDTLETDCILRDSGFYLRHCADVLVDNSIAKDNDNGFVICGGDSLGGTGSTGIVRDCTAEGNTRFGFDVGPEDVNVEFYANIACHNGTNYNSLIDSAPIKSPADARGQQNVDCSLTDQDTVDLIHSKVCTIESLVDQADNCNAVSLTQDNVGGVGATTTLATGSYCLAEDINATLAIVGDDNVTIDLNSHTLSCATDADCVVIGNDSSNTDNTTVHNGTILANGTGNGIRITSRTENICINDITFRDGDRGIFVVSDNLNQPGDGLFVDNCKFFDVDTGIDYKFDKGFVTTRITNCEFYLVCVGIKMQPDDGETVAATDVLIENCFISEPSITGIIFDGVFEARVENCTIQNSLNNTTNCVTDMMSLCLGRGICATNCSRLLFKNCESMQCASDGYIVVNCTSVTFKDCTAHDNVGVGFAFDRGGDIHVVDCSSNNNSLGFRVQDFFTLGNATSASFVNCFAQNNSVEGFRFTDVDVLLLDYCTSFNNGNRGYTISSVTEGSIKNSCALSNGAGGFVLFNPTSDIRLYANIACDNVSANYSNVTAGAPITSLANARGVHNVDCDSTDGDIVEETFTKVCTIESKVCDLALCEPIALTQEDIGIAGATTTLATGSYCLAEDISATLVVETSSSDNVTIDLNNHVLSCATNANCIVFGDDTNLTQNLTVKNGTIQANGTGSGVLVDGQTRNICIDNVVLRDGARGIFVSATSANPGDGLFVEDCKFYSQSTAGIEITFDGGYETVRVKGSDFYLGATGILLSSNGPVQDVQIAECLFSELTGDGIDCDTTEDVRIKYCTVYRCSGNGFDFDSCQQVSLEDCVSSQNTSNGIRFVDSLRVSVKNCNAQENGMSGFRVDTSTGIVLENNISLDNAIGFRFDTTTGVVVGDNTAMDNAGDGFIFITPDHTTVKNCVSESNGGYGFRDITPTTIHYYSNIACNNIPSNYNLTGTPSAPITSPTNARGVDNVDCSDTTPDVVESKLCLLLDLHKSVDEGFRMYGDNINEDNEIARMLALILAKVERLEKIIEGDK